MKVKDKTLIGWGISVVSFIIIMTVDQTVYIGIWPSSLPVVLLVIHTLYFRADLKGKHRIPYWIFVMFFLTIVYFSLPKFTYNQAQGIVTDKYEIMYEKEKILPVNGSGFQPFALTHFYFFKVKSMDSEFKVMVNPDTGEIIELR